MKISVSVDGGMEIIDLDNIDLEGYNNLLSELFVDTGLPDDAKTLLYSGNINLGSKDISALDVVKDIEGIRLIRNTDLGKFVESETGLDILKAAIENELERGTFSVDKIEGQIKWKYKESGYIDIVNAINGYNQLSDDAVDKLIGKLIDGYLYDAKNGAWATASYLFNLGDGQDVIAESSGTDKVIFGEDIDSEDLMFAREGNNLKISVIGQEDSITISNYYYNNNYKVESFQTADGSMLDYTKLDLMIQAMASFEDATGMMWEDVVQNKNEQANDIINQWWTKE